MPLGINFLSLENSLKNRDKTNRSLLRAQFKNLGEDIIGDSFLQNWPH